MRCRLLETAFIKVYAQCSKFRDNDQHGSFSKVWVPHKPEEPRKLVGVLSTSDFIPGKADTCRGHPFPVPTASGLRGIENRSMQERAREFETRSSLQLSTAGVVGLKLNGGR